MTITTAVNEAKDDLDTALGEMRRLDLLLTSEVLMSMPDGMTIGNSLDIVAAKLRRVRASL